MFHVGGPIPQPALDAIRLIELFYLWDKGKKGLELPWHGSGVLERNISSVSWQKIQDPKQILQRRVLQLLHLTECSSSRLNIFSSFFQEYNQLCFFQSRRQEVTLLTNTAEQGSNSLSTGKALQGQQRLKLWWQQTQNCPCGSSWGRRTHQASQSSIF